MCPGNQCKCKNQSEQIKRLQVLGVIMLNAYILTKADGAQSPGAKFLYNSLNGVISLYLIKISHDII